MDKIKNQVFRSPSSFNWNEREAIVKEYISSRCTKVEIWRKYTGLKEEHGELLRWMRTLGYAPAKLSSTRKSLSLILKPSVILEESQNEKTSEELLARIRDLEKQLESSQLLLEGYELMVDIAERELKIPIRKKSATK